MQLQPQYADGLYQIENKNIIYFSLINHFIYLKLLMLTDLINLRGALLRQSLTNISTYPFLNLINHKQHHANLRESFLLTYHKIPILFPFLQSRLGFFIYYLRSFLSFSLMQPLLQYPQFLLLLQNHKPRQQ